jgi:hypothetical protein
MIHANLFRVENRIGKPDSKTSGIDSLKRCLNKKHFKSYKKDITYSYNSKGFRDHEWPEDLSDVVWCVGDSFTVGIGQPFEETWPQVLQKKLGKRCLNLGEDGCSNDTMALRIQEIYESYNPKFLVVMWSYFSRRRTNGTDVAYDKDNFGEDQDLKNFIKNFKTVNSLQTRVCNFAVPDSFSDEETLKKRYPTLNIVKRLDYARDRHHFDVKTSNGICDLIIKKVNLDNSPRYPI